MKKHTIKNIALLAIAGLGIITSAKATQLTYNKGDLMMGFYESGAANTYLVDLGAASTYRDATSNFTLSLGNIGADLSTVFGSGWATDSNLQWGIFGANYQTAVNGDAVDTLYASAPEQTLGQEATAFTAETARVQAAPASLINTLGTDAASVNYSTTANSNVAVIETATNNGSFAFYQNSNGTQSFSYFNGALGGGFSGASITTSPLDLFRMDPNTSGSAGTYEGTFSVNSIGTVNYSLTPVPEPSTVYMALALVAFIGWRSRRHLASLLQA